MTKKKIWFFFLLFRGYFQLGHREYLIKETCIEVTLETLNNIADTELRGCNNVDNPLKVLKNQMLHPNNFLQILFFYFWACWHIAMKLPFVFPFKCMLGVMSIFMKIFLKNYSWGIPNPEVGADQDFFICFMENLSIHLIYHNLIFL